MAPDQYAQAVQAWGSVSGNLQSEGRFFSCAFLSPFSPFPHFSLELSIIPSPYHVVMEVDGQLVYRWGHGVHSSIGFVLWVCALHLQRTAFGIQRVLIAHTQSRR